MSNVHPVKLTAADKVLDQREIARLRDSLFDSRALLRVCHTALDTTDGSDNEQLVLLQVIGKLSAVAEALDGAAGVDHE